jgi:LacI family transcriptional regulator
MIKERRTAKLSDVARLANVSTATVSRALTLPHKLKPGTLARIQQAVQELGYVAHGAARALATRRTHTIGAVIPTLDNAIFANTTHALQKALDEAGYTLLLASHEFDTDNELRVTRALIARGIDGLVLVGTTHHPDLFRLIEAHGVPYVLSWAVDKTGRQPCVGFDNSAAAMRIVKFLLELGHRRFAMISGITANNERAQERRDAVREALAARGIALGPARLVEKPFTLSAGREGLAEVLDAREPTPTAVICGNDVLAIGAIAECHARGLRVPEDVSVTGFDDMEIAALITPSLTTVRFPTAELGSLAAQHLLARLAGKTAPLKRTLPFELMVRESSAPPRRARKRATAS